MKLRTLPWVLVAVAALATTSTTAHAGDNFTRPTEEELKMTALPGYPGAAAVVLSRDIVTNDDNHSQAHYERIKVLSEKGKDYANVELRFVSGKSDGFYQGDEKDITDIQGRTIHPDGTIIPFTGKPYQKTIENASLFKYQARVFTLPDVEVGSIIEYRYVIRIADNIFEAPDWYIQGPLFVRSAHYLWLPTVKELGSEDGMINSIMFFPILPPGAEVKRSQKPNNGAYVFDLNVKDVAPLPREEYMPPIDGLSYRVLFSYTPYRTADEFWKNEGNRWSKRVDSFTGPDSALRDQTASATAGATTPDEKLRRIYATVMSFENTDYTRSHERTEDKSEGLGKVSRASDVFTRKRGSSMQLTELFVGMARAAGFKAYVFLLPDRSKNIFVQGYLSFQQFDDVVAVVNIDGAEKFFDPGTRFCDYGHLAWEHSFVRGLRQVDGGTTLSQTPGDEYKANITARIGDLTLEPSGEAHGTVVLRYTGAPALHWRQRALTGDEESLRRSLREHAESILPRGLEVKVTSIAGQDTYDKPLTVNFSVQGALGTGTGKRLLLPSDIFVVNDAETFPQEKRDLPVYFHYAQLFQDVTRIKVPATLQVEATPAESSGMFQKYGSYRRITDTKPDSITVRRDFAFNTILVNTADYSALRSFYADMQAKDREPVVLKAATTAPAGN